MKISIYPCIVKSKALSDGSHRIRIAVSYRNKTRYIVTRYVIASERNFRNGKVTGTPTDSATNRKLSETIEKYYRIYDEIENSELLDASQIVEIFKDGLSSSMTFGLAVEEWITYKKRNVIKESSISLYRRSCKDFCDFFGESTQLSILTPSLVTQYLTHLTRRGLSQMTSTIRMNTLKNLVHFAIKRGYVSYKISPFVDYHTPPATIRDLALTVDQLRRFRDLPLTRANQIAARDYFFFSFYNCGMNITDIIDLDITKDVVSFRRHKTENRRRNNDYTEFTMQPEARAIADKSITKDRLLLWRKLQSLDNFHGFFLALETIRKRFLPDCKRLVMYCARKTFTQIAAELGHPDNIIEYCIGDAEHTQKTIAFYRKTNKTMADRAIRDVLDFVASDMTVEEWLKRKDPA